MIHRFGNTTRALVVATFVFAGILLVGSGVPQGTQVASVALFGDSLSYGMDAFAPGVLSGTRFTLGGSGNAFISSNEGRATTHFVQAAQKAFLDPQYSIIDFSLGANNPTTAGADYRTLAQLAVANNKTLALPVYGHVGGGFNTTSSDTVAQKLAQQYPNAVTIIDYSNVSCFRALNGKDIHPSATCYKEMAAYREKVLQEADTGIRACTADSSSPECKNRCSTTYVLIDIKNPDTPQVNDCYDKNTAIPHAAKYILTKLEACIGSEGPGKPRVPESFLKQNMCETQSVVTLKEDGTVTLKDTSTGTDTAVAIPAKCKEYVEAIQQLRKGGGATIQASATDAQACTWKGAVVCFSTGGAATDAQWTCKKKVESDNVTPTTFAPPTSLLGNLVNRVQNTLGGLGSIAQGLSRVFTGQQSSGSGANSGNGGNENANVCPSGYVRTSKNGSYVCTKEISEESTLQPQCILVSNKEVISSGEEVVLRWRTAQADTVTISSVGSGLAKNSEVILTPTQTQEYILQAKANNGVVQECSTTVVVEKAPERSATDPTVRCDPSLVEVGREVSVSWACPATASVSHADIIETDGIQEGEILVTPKRNTEYRIACQNVSGETLGENMCVVSVGKPVVDILVQPTIAEPGDRVRVSWASLFMRSCRIQGPRGFEYAYTQGVVVTEPFAIDSPLVNIQSAVYTLTCESVFGEVVSNDVTVQMRQQ